MELSYHLGEGLIFTNVVDRVGSPPFSFHQFGDHRDPATTLLIAFS
jgi:hypothetical protein